MRSVIIVFSLILTLFSWHHSQATIITPPHVCVALPDSGLTFGDDFLIKAVADSVSHDVNSVCLWYRFRRDIEDPLLPLGRWERCRHDPCCCMIDPGEAWVWIDTVKCISGYTGWVEMITVACDVAGNCQDTTMGFDDACLVVDDDVFRPGHFLFYWDTLAPGVMVTEVDGFPSPQTACGYDVWFDSLNWIAFEVKGADESELFEVEVRAILNHPSHTIFYQDNCAMPCTVSFNVEGWDLGTRDLFIHVTDPDNDKTGNAQLEVCVQHPAPLPFSLLFPPNKAFTPRRVRFDWGTAMHPDPQATVNYDLYISSSYHFPVGSTTIDSSLETSEHSKTLDYGRYYWKVNAEDNWGGETWSDQVRSFIVAGISYSSGDFNGDGSVDIGDVAFAVNYLQRRGSPPDPMQAGDVNCDGAVDLGDVFYLLNYLFKGGPPPCEP